MGELLTSPQLASIEELCCWTHEGAWAILQSIKVDGARLNAPGGALWGALRIPEKGKQWLCKSGPALSRAGWCEVPEDETPREDPNRRVAKQSLGLFRRLQLDEAGLQARVAILNEIKLEAAAKNPSQFQTHEVAIGADALPAAGDEAWQKVTRELWNALPSRLFENFIQPCVGYVEGETMVIYTPTDAVREFLVADLADIIEDSLAVCDLASLRLAIRVQF